MPKKADNSVALPLARPRSSDLESPCAACKVRDFAVCGALTPAELDQFGDAMATISLSPGQHLIDEGEQDSHIFSITAGCLKCYKLLPDGRRQITGFLFPGDFLGLARSKTNTSSVEAITASTMCRMQRTELDLLAKAIPNLQNRLHELASEALAEVQGQILLLGRKTAHERVATFILMLSRRAGERAQTINPVDIPMSRDDIGDFLGLTTETVSRTFSRLRKSGLIGMDKDKKVEILNLEALQETAEGF